MTQLSTPLIDVATLSAHLDDADLRIVDCRWYLSEPARGRREYLEGHIPGAIFLDVHRELAAPKGPGRHPLPSRQDFEALMVRSGVSPETHVVAYDEQSGAYAARLWWLLEYFGHPRVSVLNGGIAQWKLEKLALETHIPSPAPGRFVARPGGREVVDRQGVAERPAQTVLVDARAPDRFRGDNEPIDPRAGHIPGAQNLPFTGNLEQGRFLEREPLLARFEGAGIQTDSPVIAYCGSGITACHLLLAMRIAGLPDGALYEGSWSDWCADPLAPVAIGEEA